MMVLDTADGDMFVLCTDYFAACDDNQIGDAGCIALAEALKVNTTVTEIK